MIQYILKYVTMNIWKDNIGEFLFYSEYFNIYLMIFWFKNISTFSDFWLSWDKVSQIPGPGTLNTKDSQIRV